MALTAAGKPVAKCKVCGKTLVQCKYKGKHPASAAKKKTFTTSVTGARDGHEYVDLGLSVMWATCNVGADAINAFGTLHAWGMSDTVVYDWESYPHPEWKYGLGNQQLPREHDTATNLWGGVWRMPTYQEFSELKSKCRWNWVEYQGTWGCKVTGPNGNCIFLPAAGSTAGDFYEPNKQGLYWSSSALGEPNQVSEQKRLRFRQGLVSLDYSHGPQVCMSIRPVFSR